MAKTDFYDELDLRYPEIAICLDDIDRTNPGTKNFYIPVLTPNVDTDSLKTKVQTHRQTNSTLANESKPNISSIQIQNYIPIKIPKELCAFVGGDFHVVNVDSIDIASNGQIYISGSTGSSGCSLTGTHSHSTMSGRSSYSITGAKETTYKGILNIIPTDEYRYIKKGSKWIVVFIGGDINKPQLIGRYMENE